MCLAGVAALATHSPVCTSVAERLCITDCRWLILMCDVTSTRLSSERHSAVGWLDILTSTASTRWLTSSRGQRQSVVYSRPHNEFLYVLCTHYVLSLIIYCLIFFVVFAATTGRRLVFSSACLCLFQTIFLSHKNLIFLACLMPCTHSLTYRPTNLVSVKRALRASYAFSATSIRPKTVVRPVREERSRANFLSQWRYAYLLRFDR